MGKGKGLWIFKITAPLFRTVLVIHIELLLCSYCPKEFCPGLQTPLFANSIPHLHISCNTPCLPLPPPPIFLFLLSVTVVLREIGDNEYTECLGANKVYYGRCTNGDWSQVPFVRSSCYCGCGREGSAMKRDRKVFCFII